MPGLELKGGGVHLLFSCIPRIILIIGLKLHAPTCQVLSASLLLVTSPQRVAPRCVVVFYSSHTILRFLDTGRAGVVCREFISTVETILIWVTAFETVFPVLGLLVGLCCILCGRCAAPQCFYVL